MEQYTPMIRQYLEIKADYPDAFLFFRLGDFYELFFEDAIEASRILEITLTGRDGGKERVPMCGVPHHSVESYIKTLIEKGYKVAICEQVEDPKEAKGVVKREVTRVITPGTVMDGAMLTAENNYLGAIVKEKRGYGLAFCDLTTGEFYALEQEADSWFQVIEEVLPYSPKEILIPASLDPHEISQLQSYHRCTLTRIEPNGESGEEMARAAAEWFPRQSSLLSPVSAKAAGALIAYVQKTQKRSVSHFQELKIIQSKRYLILDPFTRRNLELTETVRTKSKNGSLLWFLDRTVTPMGGRLLKRWLDKPLTQPDKIEERLDGVQFFVEHSLIRAEIRHLLKKVYDLERLAGRVSYGNANARDMVQIRRSLEVVPELVAQFEQAGSGLPGVIRFIEGMDDCQDIRRHLEEAIVDDPPVSLKEGGLIKDGYHPHLDRLREASRSGKEWIAALEQKEREATGIRSLKVGYNKVFGYYIEVTKANLASIPEGRYERRQTLANAERFVTPELKEKEALILEAEEKMGELEYELFLQVRQFLMDHLGRLQRLAEQLATLDVLAALAEVAEERRYVRPEISADGKLWIEEGRHPVIEAVLEGRRYIPNSTYMDREQQIYLITGPNMAGKSTYMRQVAIILILFQMGSFVPARRAVLPIVDRIFTRIGAADDLVEGQSTFMVEMNEIKVTTTQATADSLVIIDELGRGTSTQDGLAIAQAVIEHLHDQVGCKTLVSTHFHELAALEDRLQRLKNYHMAVKETEEDVIFTRQLVRGAASKSYGIYCAQLAGLPKSIIDRANQLLAEMEAERSVQLELFPQEAAAAALPCPKEEADRDERIRQVVEEIRSLDLVNITPLQALNLLFELQKKAEQIMENGGHGHAEDSHHG